MSDIHLLDRIRKRLSINRVSRMQLHYAAIIDAIEPRGKSDIAEFAFFKETFERYHAKTRTLVRMRFILYLFLYATLVINVFKAIPVLSFLVGFIELGSAIFSTTVLFFLVFILSMKVNLHLELMNESLTHLIALYHKNPKRNTESVLRAIRKTL